MSHPAAVRYRDIKLGHRVRSATDIIGGGFSDMLCTYNGPDPDTDKLRLLVLARPYAALMPYDFGIGNVAYVAVETVKIPYYDDSTARHYVILGSDPHFPNPEK